MVRSFLDEHRVHAGEWVYTKRAAHHIPKAALFGQGSPGIGLNTPRLRPLLKTDQGKRHRISLAVGDRTVWRTRDFCASAITMALRANPAWTRGYYRVTTKRTKGGEEERVHGVRRSTTGR